MNRSETTFKKKLANIIFETDTRSAKAFDAVLLVVILLSVILVVIESIESIHAKYGRELYLIEWAITILFTTEYLIRLFLARHASHYAVSFYGVIDLLAILPTYIELFIAGPHYLMVIRALRLLRLFRIFKLTRYIKAAETIKTALKAGLTKILVFLGAIATAVLIIGATMYLIEGPEHGFYNMPVSIYWAIKTMTPVGEGALNPQTPMGKTLAAVLMILGYAILAIPTGIISSEITKASLHEQHKRKCLYCGKTGHEDRAEFCKYCGGKLEGNE